MMEIAIIVALIMSLSELLKQLDVIDKKFLPLINVILGLISGLTLLDGEITENVVTGIMLGLSASGLFDQTKISKTGGGKK